MLPRSIGDHCTATWSAAEIPNESGAHAERWPPRFRGCHGADLAQPRRERERERERLGRRDSLANFIPKMGRWPNKQSRQVSARKKSDRVATDERTGIQRRSSRPRRRTHRSRERPGRVHATYTHTHTHARTYVYIYIYARAIALSRRRGRRNQNDPYGESRDTCRRRILWRRSAEPSFVDFRDDVIRLVFVTRRRPKNYSLEFSVFHHLTVQWNGGAN